MNKTQLEFAVQWLERKQKTLQIVSKDNKEEADFVRGYAKGIKFANEYYQESIQELRQLLDGYLVEDVKFDEMESEEHVS